MRLDHLACAITVVTISACASNAALPSEPVVYSQAEAADSVRVRVGQTIAVDGVKVRFSTVESDSRCPMDVVCVWEGDAVAVFVVEQNCDCRSPAFELELHTSLQPRRGSAYGYSVELVQLTPYPRASSPIKPDAYSAWIRVKRES